MNILDLQATLLLLSYKNITHFSGDTPQELIYLRKNDNILILDSVHNRLSITGPFIKTKHIYLRGKSIKDTMYKINTNPQ